MGGQNGFIIHHYNRQYQIYPDFTYFCARIMNLQMETMTDNNEMNAGNGTPMLPLPRGRVPLPGRKRGM